MKIEGDCPHCKKNVAIDIDKLEVKQPQAAQMENASTTQTQVLEQKPAEPQIREVIKEKKVVSSDQPFFECKNCDSLHKNPDYKEPPRKRCANGNCSTLNKSKAKGCKNCGSSEFEEDELTDEELTEMGIPIPENSHEDHEHDVE